MSVPKTCRCGRMFETGLTSSRQTCRQCRRREERLASGGYPLTNTERAALAALEGVDVPSDALPFHVDERAREFVWGDDHGFHDYGSDRRVSAVPKSLIPEAE